MHWESGLPTDHIQIIERSALPPALGAEADLGNKAFNLLKLAAAGFPVPPAFVLPTGWCRDWAHNRSDFKALVSGPMERLERASGLGFGELRRPLLVSVRSGAPVSMPGMLDTVLNIGLTRATLPGLAALTGNPHLAWDCYARLIESYATVAAGLDGKAFAQARGNALQAAGAKSLAELDTLSVRSLAEAYLSLYRDQAGEAFPDNPMLQLRSAVDAVFGSWDSERARSYRRIHGIGDVAGTAVTVQRMVYGNSGPCSGAGVAFTRDPSTGAAGLYLDFAFNAQGEDVVSGRRAIVDSQHLDRLPPGTIQALEVIASRLEKTFLDAQDFEFTIQEGELFLLQTRDAKPSLWARLKIAVDLVQEGLITPDEALARLKGLDLSRIVRQRVAEGGRMPIGRGIPAGPGVASGAIALSAEGARSEGRTRKVILVRADIVTSDIEGIAACQGILTARGGRTSHAAVVARELGKTAIVGCEGLRLAEDGASCAIGGRQFRAGAEITLDGETGSIYDGIVAFKEERPEAELAQVARWKQEGLVRKNAG